MNSKNIPNIQQKKLRKKILLSAFTCNPSSGSEAAYGWNWATGLVNENFEVHCLTRITNKTKISKHPNVPGLHFHYISVPIGLEFLYAYSQSTMYFYYLIWQWKALCYAKKLQKIHRFEKVHHVTWGSLQQGSFLYKLNIPFIFGPAGGGQVAPEAFKDYFLHYWVAEKKREKVSKLMLRFSPACRKMLLKADAVIVSNTDTMALAKAGGAKRTFFTLDTAIPESFFPSHPLSRQITSGKLKLLWVGRFLPRKGLVFVLEVMKELKKYPGITLTLVGDGEIRETVIKLHKEFQLEDTVNLVGSVPYGKVREYYAEHDAFFFTSLRESGGVQLVEAMAFGLPIITLDLHGSSEIVTEHTGFKIPISEPEQVKAELVQAIVRLSNDPEGYKTMSNSASSFAKEQTWSKKIRSVIKNCYNT